MDFENQLILQAKRENKTYKVELLPNGDSVKQLLARSRYGLRVFWLDPKTAINEKTT